jgi:hypothetical protein
VACWNGIKTLGRKPEPRVAASYARTPAIVTEAGKKRENLARMMALGENHA